MVATMAVTMVAIMAETMEGIMVETMAATIAEKVVVEMVKVKTVKKAATKMKMGSKMKVTKRTAARIAAVRANPTAAALRSVTIASKSEAAVGPTNATKTPPGLLVLRNAHPNLPEA